MVQYLPEPNQNNIAPRITVKYTDLTDTPTAHTAEAIPHVNAGGTAIVYDDDFKFDGTNLKLGGTTGGTISVASGVFTFAGTGNTHNENFQINTNQVANEIYFQSTSGANVITLDGFDIVRVAQDIRHLTDNDTKINFTLDRIRLYAGNVVMVDCQEAATDTLGLGNTGTVDVSIGSSGSKIGMFGASAVAQSAAYSVSGSIPSRTLTATSDLSETKQVIAAIVSDLQALGPFG